ncbi:hypothetical protein HZB78_01175 [Candidatus Collierbacteria bacterium]|nr:hypothetical protein [Candidatus Collierbacteria bacterium]
MLLTSGDISKLKKNFLTKDEFLKTIDRLTSIFITKGEFLEAIDRLERKFLGKDDFFMSMDKMMKELETIRQEQILTPSHADISNLEDRIEKVEQQLISVS